MTAVLGVTALPPGEGPDAIDKSGKVWLIVAIAGFLTGFGLFTGPLAWYFGKELVAKAAQTGVPPGSAEHARLLGKVITIFHIVLAALFVVWIVAMLIFGLGRLAWMYPHGT